jgi:hypothetical protein
MWRALCAAAALAGLLVIALVRPIPLGSFVMGDGSSIVQQRESFEELVGRIRFSSHLAYHALDRIDAALGSTDTSPLEAYRALAWLAGAGFAIALLGLAAAERWSPPVVRYMGLAVLAPATLMFFGYLDVGYLALSAVAFPLVARDLHQGGGELTPGLLAGALLYGLGAALHGIGYLGIAALCVAILAADLPIRRRLVMATALGAIAMGASLIWLWYYLAVLGRDVIPHHAANGAVWRSLWEAREAESRIVQPLLSAFAARDLAMASLVAGVPLVLVVLGIRKTWARDARLALAFTVPCLVFFLFLWPNQGVAIEMDLIVAAFPAIYPLLWICSRSVPATFVAAGLLAIGHWTFWRVVVDDRFINQMLR